MPRDEVAYYSATVGTPVQQKLAARVAVLSRCIVVNGFDPKVEIQL